MCSSDLVPRAGEAAAYLLADEPSSFSAVTVFHGAHRLIVHNDAHHLYRQNSNIAHELSHALLFHEPTPALDDLGSRYWNQNIEDEANWLAGVLLMTEDATLHAVRRAWSMQHIGESFGVSPQMATWRINSTGARKRVARGPHMRRVAHEDLVRRGRPASDWARGSVTIPAGTVRSSASASFDRLCSVICLNIRRCTPRS